MVIVCHPFSYLFHLPKKYKIITSPINKLHLKKKKGATTSAWSEHERGDGAKGVKQVDPDDVYSACKSNIQLVRF